MAVAATVAAVAAAKAKNQGTSSTADSKREAQERRQAQEEADRVEQARRAGRSAPLIIWETFTEFVNKPGVQCLLYFAFVYVFQNIANCMRVRTEFYMCAAPERPWQ